MGRKNRAAKIKKKTKVVTGLNESIKKKSESRYSVDQLLDKAEECIDSFNYDLAEKFCQRALEINPDHIRALEMCGTLLLETGDVENAKQYFSHAIELEPDKGHSKYMYLAQLLTGEDAIQCFSKGINIMKQELEHGSTHQDTEGNGGSSSSQSTSTVTRKDVSSGYCSIAEIYLTDSCFEEDAESKCKQCLDEALAADENNPEVYHLLASYYISLGDIQSAEQSVEKGVSLWLPQLREAEKPEGAAAVDPVEVCPINYPARVNVVKILIELEKYELATEILELLLDEDDTVVEVWYLLGWANYLQGEDFKPTAKYYLEKAKKIAKETHFDDEQLTAHIEELLEELASVGNNECAEEEVDGDMEVETDTDSEEDGAAESEQVNGETEQMEH